MRVTAHRLSDTARQARLVPPTPTGPWPRAQVIATWPARVVRNAPEADSRSGCCQAPQWQDRPVADAAAPSKVMSVGLCASGALSRTQTISAARRPGVAERPEARTCRGQPRSCVHVLSTVHCTRWIGPPVFHARPDRAPRACRRPGRVTPRAGVVTMGLLVPVLGSGSGRLSKVASSRCDGPGSRGRHPGTGTVPPRRGRRRG